MSKSNFVVGQSVIADGKPGFTIEKLMNLSAKVIDVVGHSKIVPYALLEPAKNTTALKPTTVKPTTVKTNAVKKTTHVAKAEDDNGDDDNGDDDNVEGEEEVEIEQLKSKATAKSKNAPKGKIYEAESEDVQDDNEQGDEIKEPKKHYARSVGDDVSELLNLDTHNKMIDAVRKHPAYKHINAEAFKNTISQSKTLQLGLFKMRLSNLLRAAVRRSEK